MKPQILSLIGFNPGTGKLDTLLYQRAAQSYLPNVLVEGRHDDRGAHVASFYLHHHEGALALFAYGLVPFAKTLIHPDTDLIIRLETIK
jgi:hypothetical protein